MRKLFAILACAAAVSASAATVELRLPADGATLRGGSLVSIDWSSARLPANAEEWEGFLSVNGGGYYAFRITPHLDIALRRFVWLVPNVDSDDARILIRVGDERTETLFELPVSLSIVRDPHAEIPRPSLATGEQGEAARQGDPDVLEWADGDRSGEHVTRESRRAAESATLFAPAGPLAAPPATAVAPQPHAASGDSGGRRGEAAHRHAAPRSALRAARAVDILLVCCRLTI
ncbi:MAG TPA: hypothetical protein VKH35_10795 [Thermoanaerobaculia bacterium]|nr:hypothetical protein [Thermoanaerobaculia bacterium]